MSGSGILSMDKFKEMIDQLDKDGDGKVTKEEYKVVYAQAMKVNLSDAAASATFDADYETIWAKLDSDGDNNLTAAELASYYGFSWNDVGGNAANMTDEEILQVLSLQAALDEANKQASATKTAAAAPAQKVRDSSIAQIAVLDMSDDRPEVKFLIALQAYELPEIKEVVQTKLVNVRCEDSKTGELPLHKLARANAEKADYSNPDNGKKYDAHKALYNELIELTKEQAGPERFKTDVNHRNKDGKTPLAVAVEFNRRGLIKPLILSGADPMIVDERGWNILHAAVNADDLELIKEIQSCVASSARLKVLLMQTNKDGRQPIHIAAFKCNEDSGVVDYMMTLGSDAKSKDIAGNTPVALATKGGRRRSRDLIENYAQAESKTAGDAK